MKHIVLPIMNESFEDDVFFRGLDRDLVREQFFMVIQKKEDTQQIIEMKGGNARTYQIGINTEWEDVFGNIQNTFLGQDFNCQLDIIIDAEGSDRAVSTIQSIQKVFPSIGMTVSTKILFLADARSAFFREEQAFYNALKNTVLNAGKGENTLKFNCAYLMIALNDKMRNLRKRILPYIIQEESMMATPEIRTCGGQIREMDINSIELVPKDLAVKTVCAMLCTKPLTNPIPMFLMASGNIANKTPREQLENFKIKLEEMDPVLLPSDVDLLVQKRSPDSVLSTNEIFANFCEDNPDSNPDAYDKAANESLTQMPEVVNAVYEWENKIVRQACEKGDLSDYIEQMRSGSEFDRLLTEHQNPMVMQVTKTLTDKDGYTEEAIQKLENYTLSLQNALRNSVFSARLRLIQSRLPEMRYRLENVQRSRQEAVQKKRSESLTKDVTGLIENWCKDISTKLTNAANSIDLPKETDDVSAWIEESADALMEKIPTPDYETGKKELAESGIKIIGNMRANTDDRLITIALTPAVGVPLPERWIVYRQMMSNEEFQRTYEPVVIKVAEWYLHPEQCTQMDETMFQKPLNQVVTQSAYTERNPEKQDTEEETAEGKELVRIDRNNREELETYNGVLTWIWKDMRYTNARLEVYADTGTPDALDKPVFSVSLHYTPDDRYTIGRTDDLPSGVPLIFRVVYLDKGKDVRDIVQEIRMRAPRTRLEVELIQVKEGKFLKKKPYNRLKLRSSGSFSQYHIAVASSTGHVYSAEWEETEDGWLSELLPSFENWRVVDRPGDLIEYEIIQ